MRRKTAQENGKQCTTQKIKAVKKGETEKRQRRVSMTSRESNYHGVESIAISHPDNSDRISQIIH